MKSWSDKNKRIILKYLFLCILFLIQSVTFAQDNDFATVTIENNEIEYRNGDIIELSGEGFSANEQLSAVTLTLIDNQRHVIGDAFINEYSLTVDENGVLSGSFALEQIPENATHVEVVVYAQKTNTRGSNWINVSGSGIFLGGLNTDAAGTVSIADDGSQGGGGDNDGIAETSEDIDLSGSGWTGTLSLIGQREYSDIFASTFNISTGLSTANSSIDGGGNLTGYATLTGSFDASTASIRIRVTNNSVESTDSDSMLVPDGTNPTVQSASKTDSVTIVVTFSEPVTAPSGASATDNWTITDEHSSSYTVSSVTPTTLSTTKTLTLSGTGISDPGDTTNVQFTTGTNEYEDAAGNDANSTTSPHIDATDDTPPRQPNLTLPITSTIMDGGSTTLQATADSRTNDSSIDSVRFEGSNNGTAWTGVGGDNNTSDGTYTYNYTFGTKYKYYRAVAVDDRGNETVSTSSVDLTDAYRIEITSFDSPVDPGTRSQFRITIQNNYADGVAYGSNLSFNLTTDASSGAAFYAASSGGSPITARVITAADSDTVFWYEDANAGTTPTVTVTEAASNLDDDNDSQQITINASGIDHFHVTTGGSGTETAGTAFNVTVTAHDAAHATATAYVGTHSLTWSTSATNSPKDSVPEIPADGNRTFTAGVLTITNGATFFDSGESPTLTVTDGSASTSDGPGATGITVNDATIAEVRIKTADESADNNYANNVYGDSTFQGPTQADPDKSTILYAVNYDDYGNLLPDDGTSTWSTTGTVPGSFSSGTGSSVTFTFDGTGGTGSSTTGTITNTSSGNTGATGTINVDDDDGATVTGFGVTTDGGDNRYVFASWTSTSSGDDGTTGTPTDYEIVWTVEANGPINTVGEWNSATSVGTAGKPAFSSGTWRIDMSSFPEGNKYFAIRTYDDVGNISVLGSGSYTTSSDYSLPVELLLFEANAEFSKVNLKWSTASEIENLGFNLYRTQSGNQDEWQRINESIIPGQGNSSQKADYEFTDDKVKASESYKYRLESVSVNGVVEVLQTINVTIPVPTVYTLFENYPNPFNPITNIKFQLPEQNQVSIAIYDIQGHLVKNLLTKENYNAGEYVIQWNATDQNGVKVSSGLYFYRFVSGKFEKFGKMMLVK